MTSDHTFAVVAALGCAATWAFASVVFARVLRGNASVDVHALNLLKCSIAFPLLVLGSVVSGAGLPILWDSSDGSGARAGWMVLSAVLGLVVADTGYFLALRRLGAARGVLFIPLVPVMTALLAALFLHEPLSVQIGVGMVVTLAGLSVVLLQPQALSTTTTKQAGLVGLVGGLVYALSQALANVVSKHVLDEALAIHVAAWRIGIGAAVLLVVSAATGSLPGLRPLLVPRALALVVVTSLIGTVAGMWLGMIGTKGLPVGVATTLAATTPLWAIALARFFGETVSRRALLGSLLAVVGVVILASVQH